MKATKKTTRLVWRYGALVLVLLLVIVGVSQGASLLAPASSVAAEYSDEAGLTSSLAPSQAFTITLPIALKNRGSAPPPSIFGAQLYHAISEETAALNLARLAQMHWMRWPMNWSWVEPTNVSPDQYNWERLDASIRSAWASGHELIVTIGTNPEWAATYPQGPIDKVPLSEFTDFVGALVERYDGDGYQDAPGSPVVSYWEFYNEPDGASLVNAERGFMSYWGNYGAEYAAMLCASYDVVKASNPSANVVIGGLAYDSFFENGGSFNPEFLDDVMNAGGGDCFDVMNFHYYPGFEPVWSQYGNGLLGKANYLQGQMESLGYGNKPTVVTEAGWHSNYYDDVNTGSPELQSRYIVKLFTQAAAADLESLIWWTWVDPEPPNGENGLITRDLAPKTSFGTYQHAADKIGRAQFVRIYPTRAEVEGYQFTGSQGLPLYLFWSKVEGTSYTVRVEASRANLINMYGKSIGEVLDGQDGNVDGYITFSVDANPVYVEVR